MLVPLSLPQALCNFVLKYKLICSFCRDKEGKFPVPGVQMETGDEFLNFHLSVNIGVHHKKDHI